MLEKIITLVLLFAVIIVIVASCSAMSQDTLRYGIDRTLEVADRQPSAAELILQSRQTAPVDSNKGNTLWLGAGLAAVVVVLLGIGLAYFIFGERWLKERRRYLRATKKKPTAPTIRPLPYVDESQLRTLPTMRRVPELPRPTEEPHDYGY